MKTQQLAGQLMGLSGRLIVTAGAWTRRLFPRFAAQLRPTRQRVALAALLFGNGDRHVTAEILHEEAVRIGEQVDVVAEQRDHRIRRLLRNRERRRAVLHGSQHERPSGSSDENRLRAPRVPIPHRRQ